MKASIKIFATGDGLLTYNFDPDRWYENERSAIEAQYRSGQRTTKRYNDAIDDLQRRYDEMLDRLDGIYQIPNSNRQE